MSSSEQPLASGNVPPPTSSTPAPQWTNQTPSLNNTWPTLPATNKTFVFHPGPTTAQTSGHATQGPSTSVFGDLARFNQQRLLSGLKLNNSSNRCPTQNVPEEEEEESVEVRRTTNKRAFHHLSGTSAHRFVRPATPRQPFAQSLQASSFGRDQSQSTNPFSWGVPNTSWATGSALFNNNNNNYNHSHNPNNSHSNQNNNNNNNSQSNHNNNNNKGDYRTHESSACHPLASNLHRGAQGHRTACQQCHPHGEGGDDVGMDCDACDQPPRPKSPKHVQFGFSSSMSQNNPGSCHASFNNRPCQQHSSMMEHEAMDTDAMSQSSGRTHLPFTHSAACQLGHCPNCAPQLCQLPPCGCASRLAQHLRPLMQQGLQHQSQVRKKVLFIEEINLDVPVNPFPRSCSHFGRGCAGAPTWPNDPPPPACMHVHHPSTLQHHRNLPPADDGYECRPCGRAASSHLDGQSTSSRTPRGILKTPRRHSTIALPSCQQESVAERCRTMSERRLPECQSANSFGFSKRTVSFDPRLPADDHAKSNADSFVDDGGGNGDPDVIFVKRQRTENG